MALDVIQDRHHFIFAELALEAKHGCSKSRVAAVGDDVQQQLIRVVPGVAAAIVRRGRIASILLRLLPVGLAFELSAMTGSAILRVQSLAHRDAVSIERGQGRHGCPLDDDRLRDGTSGEQYREALQEGSGAASQFQATPEKLWREALRPIVRLHFNLYFPLIDLFD